MSTKPLMRRVAVGAAYAALLSARTVVASVTISCPPTNAGPVYFEGDDGSDVPWVPGEWHELAGVNLAEVRVKGTPGASLDGTY